MSNPRRRTPVTRPESLKTNPTLKKGSTFHTPTTPPSSPPAFRVPSLPRRSQTDLDEFIDAHRRRAALNIDKVESILASVSLDSAASSPSFRDDSLPVPRGFLDHMIIDSPPHEPSATMDPETGRRVLRPRPVRRSPRHHESDSGLGTSIASKPSSKDTKASAGASVITHSVTGTQSESMRRLSARAMNRIHEHALKPLLAKSTLKDFHPVVLDCPRMMQEKQIVCLRDLEKTLLFMAPERTKSAKLYFDFCMTSVRCIQATVEYLSDREQTRPRDRPYSHGYFIDLVEQIRQHAQQMQEARRRQAAGEEPKDTDADPTDEVKLMGGLATTGRPAELVRVKKNGKAVSLATGEPVEDLEEETKAPIRFKRSMSEQLEDEEEIMRSMARRKKNASPEELAPKKCKEPGCNKEFKRPCDLTKHEKTHSRPWKCPNETCKYHEYGWPTEKEMQRHINDKHSDAPPMFECHFKPCPYKSKRESNCKQHMEKAHGWVYHRTKTNGKKAGSKAGSSTTQTPVVPSMPTPSSDQSHPIMTPPEEPFDFSTLIPAEYASAEEFNLDAALQVPFEGDIQLDYSPINESVSTPSTDGGQFNGFPGLTPDFTGQFETEDLYGAHVQIPTPTHSIYNKLQPGVFNFAPEMFPATSAPPMPNISPAGQGNAMLYTPNSMAELDEGLDDCAMAEQYAGNNDFVLFPSAMTKTPGFDMTGVMTMPSVAAGYSQPSSQDFNLYDNANAMDWAPANYNNYPSQQ